MHFARLSSVHGQIQLFLDTASKSTVYRHYYLNLGSRYEQLKYKINDLRYALSYLRPLINFEYNSFFISGSKHIFLF